MQNCGVAARRSFIWRQAGLLFSNYYFVLSPGVEIWSALEAESALELKKDMYSPTYKKPL
jgi:hypothetical protein